MKNKNGFTLIELLAVIAILALLVVFAVPNIIKMFGDSKKKAFVTETQSVFKTAESEIISRQIKKPKFDIKRFYSENISDRLSLSKSACSSARARCASSCAASRSAPPTTTRSRASCAAASRR